MCSFLTLGVEDKDNEFVTSLLEKTCTYEKQWLPKPMQKLCLLMKDEFRSFDLGLDVANEEAQVIVGRALEELFERSKVDPSRVDVLVCMSTQMTSLQQNIAGQFGFREDVEVMTLGGAGCAAGVAATDFANKYLGQRETPTTMVVVIHENLTRGFYSGLSRESMVTNALFRAGAGAMLFSTDPALEAQAKFRMDYSTRTYQTDPRSLFAFGYKLDDTGVGGFYLPKKNELRDISARAIMSTIARVGRNILPLGEKLKYVLSLGKKTPNFKKAIDHMFVHPGGPAVIDGLGEALGYDAAVESANAINAYYYYGNTSSSGILYVMSYTESLQGIKKGERMLALGMGVGFESNGTVMTAMRDCGDVHRAWRHVAEDPSLQPLAVDAFIRGFRNRERVCTLDASEERKVRDLIALAAICGYTNPYGPEPSPAEGTSSVDMGDAFDLTSSGSIDGESYHSDSVVSIEPSYRSCVPSKSPKKTVKAWPTSPIT